MANELFSTLLKNILDAPIDPSYEPIGKTVATARALAGLISTFDPDAALPKPSSNLNTRLNISPELVIKFDGSFQQLVDLALTLTAALAECMTRLKKYPPNQQELDTQRGNFLQCTGFFVSVWARILPVLQAVAGNEVFAKTRDLQNAAQNDAQAIHALLVASQEAAKKIGAGQHAEAFNTLAGEYKKKSDHEFKWTIAIALIFIAVVVATGIWTFSIPKDDYGRLVQVVIGKILALGVLYYILVLVARSYRANAHLAAVNLHRATSLQIFATFADSTSDDQTKNAILLETTRSIYSHTPTGFLTGEDPSSPIQIVEILKALGPNKG